MLTFPQKLGTACCREATLSLVIFRVQFDLCYSQEIFSTVGEDTLNHTAETDHFSRPSQSAISNSVEATNLADLPRKIVDIYGEVA